MSCLYNITEAGIRITRNCNLKCQYCNIQSIKKNDLTIDEWKIAGKILKKIGIKNLVILGGEPTEYEFLNEFVSFFENDLDIRCSMTTNAYNNFDKIIDVIESGLSRIGVSVDSLDVTKSISPFKDKMGLEMIDNLISLHKNINVIDYVVLSKKNIDNIEDLIKYMSSKNISVYILPFHHSNEGEFEHRKNKQKNAFITDEDIDSYNKIIDKIIEMKNEGYLVSNSADFLNISKNHIRNLDWKCKGLSELRIDSDGRMVCCCDYVGKVNELYSIFDLDDPTNLEKFICDRNKDSKICNGCLWPSSVEAEIKRNNENDS